EHPPHRPPPEHLGRLGAGHDGCRHRRSQPGRSTGSRLPAARRGSGAARHHRRGRPRGCRLRHPDRRHRTADLRRGGRADRRPGRAEGCRLPRQRRRGHRHAHDRPCGRRPVPVAAVEPGPPGRGPPAGRHRPCPAPGGRGRHRCARQSRGLRARAGALRPRGRLHRRGAGRLQRPQGPRHARRRDRRRPRGQRHRSRQRRARHRHPAGARARQHRQRRVHGRRPRHRPRRRPGREGHQPVAGRSWSQQRPGRRGAVRHRPRRPRRGVGGQQPRHGQRGQLPGGLPGCPGRRLDRAQRRVVAVLVQRTGRGHRRSGRRHPVDLGQRRLRDGLRDVDGGSGRQRRRLALPGGAPRRHPGRGAGRTGQHGRGPRDPGTGRPHRRGTGGPVRPARRRPDTPSDDVPGAGRGRAPRRGAGAEGARRHPADQAGTGRPDPAVGLPPGVDRDRARELDRDRAGPGPQSGDRGGPDLLPDLLGDPQDDEVGCPGDGADRGGRHGPCSGPAGPGRARRHARRARRGPGGQGRAVRQGHPRRL
ncbi:MAG: hypothetical protein AVDCRST_MAG16-148, partial [uncultured Frankineae bacterium]